MPSPAHIFCTGTIFSCKAWPQVLILIHETEYKPAGAVRRSSMAMPKRGPNLVTMLPCMLAKLIVQI